jgi:hypothetical protein
LLPHFNWLLAHDFTIAKHLPWGQVVIFANDLVYPGVVQEDASVGTLGRVITTARQDDAVKLADVTLRKFEKDDWALFDQGVDNQRRPNNDKYRAE